MELSRAEMVDMLLTAPCSVSFTKLDGSLRNMVCSLDSKIIGNEVTIYETDITNSESNLSVYDLDLKSWRSFRLANVISFSYAE